MARNREEGVWGGGGWDPNADYAIAIQTINNVKVFCSVGFYGKNQETVIILLGQGHILNPVKYLRLTVLQK